MPYLDLSQYPYYEIGYSIDSVAGFHVLFTFFVSQIFLVTVSVYVATCFQDLQTIIVQLKDKSVGMVIQSIE